MSKLQMVMFISGKNELELCEIIGAVLLTGGAVWYDLPVIPPGPALVPLFGCE